MTPAIATILTALTALTIGLTINLATALRHNKQLTNDNEAILTTNYALIDYIDNNLLGRD